MSKIALSGDASGTGTFTIASPNSNSNYQLDLPAESGTVITTASTTGISASALSTGTIPKARMFAGAVLQVVSTTKTDTASVSSTTYTDITGLSASITPSSVNSKILVFVNVTVGPQNSNGMIWQLVRGSTAIAVNTTNSIASSGGGYTDTGASAGNAWLGFGVAHLDSPATTSSTTYKVQVRGGGSAAAVYINRRSAAADFGGVSTITLMEIAG